jgi:hypothetical protein
MYNGRKFDHAQEKISDAVGVSQESLEEVKDLTIEAIVTCSSPSRIAEFLHNKADYDQILLMATFYITDKKTELNDFLSTFG